MRERSEEYAHSEHAEEKERRNEGRGEKLRRTRAASSFLSRIPANVSGAYVERGGLCARGGTGRLNLPGEFMTELFKGCLVVLNP